ncbi:Crp/Fnr family transcriptional regulator [Pedobacter miscanthi]|uniref:Crp/Fnr family transcriptional regulator n=1 Tax=Pedobacter miscanthi TaxID=2259170 RepID=UPI00293147DF|nr:Crp/Fnr family transcriptional regulator [Pedobacter miscanthi]
MNELENYIQHYFSIDPDDCRKVASLFKVEQLEKGAYWQKAGSRCEKMSFISSGILRVFVTQSKREVTQWIGTSGYFMTDISSFLFGQPARFNIQALTDTLVFTVARSQYIELGKLIPKWNEFEKMFISKCFVVMESRIFDLISLSAEEHYTKLFDQQRELFNQVPLQYLASMLGMTPETFSRIRKKMIS